MYKETTVGSSIFVIISKLLIFKLLFSPHFQVIRYRPRYNNSSIISNLTMWLKYISWFNVWILNYRMNQSMWPMRRSVSFLVYKKKNILNNMYNNNFRTGHWSSFRSRMVPQLLTTFNQQKVIVLCPRCCKCLTWWVKWRPELIISNIIDNIRSHGWKRWHPLLMHYVGGYSIKDPI